MTPHIRLLYIKINGEDNKITEGWWTGRWWIGEALTDGYRGKNAAGFPPTCSEQQSNAAMT